MTLGARLRVLEQQLDALMAQAAAIREQVAALVSEAEAAEHAGGADVGWWNRRSP